MPAFTTRMGLYKPGGGSSGTIPDEQVDIDKINGNMDVIDTYIGAPGFTSTSRPSSPFDGQIIKETDTKRTMRYSQAGALWEPIQAVSGLVPINWPTPVVTGGGAASVQGNVLTFANANTTVVDGVFTTAFDQYLMMFDMAHSSVAFLQMIMRSAGVDYVAAGGYSRQVLTAIGASATASTSSDTKFLVSYAAVASFLGEAKLFNPANGAKSTFLDAQTGTTSGLGRIVQGSNPGAHDGVKFSPSAGVGITGTIKLFGLASALG